MKRKKVMAVTAIVFTCATIASCGKTTTETVNEEPVIQATEQVIVETEEIVQEATEKMEEESLQPTMDEFGKLIYPDYPEEYITYTPIDPIELWCIKQVDEYSNPNANKGELVRFLKSIVGIEIEVDATCEIDGVSYYRIVPINDDNNYLIIEQDALSDTPPEEDTAYTTVGDPDADGLTPEEKAKIDEIFQDTFGDLLDPANYEDAPELPDQGSLEDLPDEILDAASRLQWE